MTSHPNRSNFARGQAGPRYDASEHVSLFMSAWGGCRVWRGDDLIGTLVDAVSISPTLPLKLIVLSPSGERLRLAVRGLRIEPKTKEE